MPYEPPPALAALSLAQIAALVADRGLPPIDNWRPEVEGDSLMRIAADGRWFHDGGEVTKPAMVRAFASILMRDADGQHWLVTPTQKLRVAVDDAAFVAVDLRQDGGDIAFQLNTDDLVIAGSAHAIQATGDAETPALYVAVRHGMRARLNRSTYAQLVEIALESDDLSVTSGGRRFSLLPA